MSLHHYAATADALGGVWVPREVVTEPWLVPIAFAANAKANGAQIHTSSRVAAARRGGDGSWELETTSGHVHRAKAVINCAGLHGDHVEVLGPRDTVPFHIRPRKGQFVVFSRESAGPSTIVQPVPTQRTKGVIVWTTVYGNVVCGPTAEEQASREDRSNDEATIARLRQHAARVVPGLEDAKVVGTYSGIRPATEHRDYQITSLPGDRWITVGGIRSTGLTAASGIGEYVADLHDQLATAGPPAGETAVYTEVTPPYLPSAPLTHADTLRRNTPAGDLAALSADFRARGSGDVKVFGEEHTVTHPLSILGLSGDRVCHPPARPPAS